MTALAIAATIVTLVSLLAVAWANREIRALRAQNLALRRSNARLLAGPAGESFEEWYRRRHHGDEPPPPRPELVDELRPRGRSL